MSGIASAVVAGVASLDNHHGNRLYIFYPSRIPAANSTEYLEGGLADTEFVNGGLGRTAAQQAGFQLATLAQTIGFAVLGGILTGFLLRLPVFEQIEDVESLYDDAKFWKTPSDFNFARSQNNARVNTDTQSDNGIVV